MGSGKGKFRDFRLSQALAYPVVKKGVCGDFILCGLSPPVSADWSLVYRYTLCASTSGPEVNRKPIESGSRFTALMNRHLNLIKAPRSHSHL
jgi:hypothetical protein